MREVDIKRRDGSVIATIDLPDSLAEMPLLSYINFKVAVRDSRKEGVNEIAVMGKALSEFTGVKVHELLQAELGPGDPAEAMTGAIAPLFNYLLDLIGRHETKLRGPDSFRVTYKGEVYCIPQVLYDAATGQPHFEPLTLLEGVEVAEYKRLSEGPEARATTRKSLAEQMGVDEAEVPEGDIEGTVWFSEVLTTLAHLLRKEGEALPLDDMERERFIQGRKAHFQQIDAATALDVDFFLLSGSLSLGEVGSIGTSLILSATSLTLDRQRLNRKRPARERAEPSL